MMKPYAPSLTALTAGGGSVSGSYQFTNGFVEGSIDIVLGASCSVGFAPGIGLPVPARTRATLFPPTGGQVGSAYVSGGVYPIALLLDPLNPSLGRPYLFDTTTSAYRLIQGNTTPAPWVSGNTIGLDFRYPAANPEPLTFAACGDSMTAWYAAQEPYAAKSWVWGIKSHVFAGGTAHGSWTTSNILAGWVPVPSDVLVISAGINDPYFGVPLTTTLANLEAIAALSGAPKIVLNKISPYSATQPGMSAALIASMNVAYENLATTNGWTICDPYGAYRNAVGGWVAGASADGVHPTAAVQAAAALVIQAAL